MQTSHAIRCADARSLTMVPDRSVDLIVTSPPYPAIAMWDDLFRTLSPSIAAALDQGNGRKAFELMHRELDRVWRESARVLKDGAIVCVNIGDAVRDLGGRFQLFPNHARVVAAFGKLRFDCLPGILWRKQTNAPNKFMGSGMLPPGAYVTLEHEHILVFRKGAKREFTGAEEKRRRMESALFWEERNRWFSDLWDCKGIRQAMEGSDLRGGETRGRSGAYPFELPFRLVNMFSLQGDTVLDPFAGTGTTTLAALVAARNSIGVDIDPLLVSRAQEHIAGAADIANEWTAARIADHVAFAERRAAEKGPLRYRNTTHGFSVVTRQETGLRLTTVESIRRVGEDRFAATHRTATPTQRSSRDPGRKRRKPECRQISLEF